MDYEDNDFQSQSFQLAVEENIKFSPGSHSYSLPKFDLDDNLQIQLRFDSLVDSEVLLGIQSQEETQWIEDFSRESSGLEFSSGATESCSISRRNNVWSEATSSESVDLLLKSVGQDEMIMRQAIIEESDNCNGLDSLMNQMNPSLNQDGLSPSHLENAIDEPATQFFGLDKDDLGQLPSMNQDGISPSKMENAISVTSMSTLDGSVDKDVVDHLPSLNQDGLSPSKTENATCVRSVSTLDEPVEQFSRLDKDDVDQMPPIDSTSQNAEVEKEKFRTYLVKNENCNVTGLNEEMNLVDKSDGKMSLNDFEAPECMQDNPNTASVQNFVKVGELNCDVPQGAEGSANDNAETVRGQQILSRVTSQTCEGGHLVDVDRHNVVDLSSLVKKVDPVYITELSSDTMFAQHTVQISEFKHIILSNDVNTVDQLINKDAVDQLPSVNQDGFSSSKPEKATCIRSVSPLDDPAEQFSAVDKDVVDQLPQIDSSSQRGEGVGPINGGSRVLNSIEEEKFSGCLVRNESYNVIGLKEDIDLLNKSAGKTSLNDYEAPECPQVNRSSASVQSFINVEKFSSCLVRNENYIVTGLNENIDLVDRSEGNKSLNESEAPECMQVNASTASVQSFVKAEELDNDIPHGSDDLEKVDGGTVEDHQAPTRVTSQFCERHLVDTDCNTVGDLSSLVKKVDSVSEITELSSSAMFTQHTAQISEFEHIISSNDADVVDQLIENSQETSCLMVEGETAYANISANVTGVLSVQIMHTSDQATQGCSNIESIVKQEKLSENVCQGNEVSGDHVEHSSSLLMEMCSLTDITHESRMSEDIKDGDDSLGVYSAVTCSSSPLLAEFQQRCAQTLTEAGPNVVHLCHPDASTLESETGKLLTDSELTGLVPEVVNMASDNILDGVHHLLLNSNIAKDDAVHHQENQHSPSHEIRSLPGKEEEAVSRKSILDIKECSQILNECVPTPEFEHGKDCDHATEMQAKIVDPSSSSLGISGIKLQNESALDVAIIDSQQRCSEGLEQCPVIHDIAVKEKVGADVWEHYNNTGVCKENKDAEVCKQYNKEGVPIEAEGIRPSHEETTRYPLSSSMRESSHDFGLKDLEDKDAFETNNAFRNSLASTEGVSLDGRESTSGPATLSDVDAEGHVLEAESSILNSSEPNCGSPTTISCTVASESDKEHAERSMGSLDHMDSDVREQEANKVTHGAADPKDHDTFEDDRSFTFKVSSVADNSEKAGGGWKPFPNIPPYNVPQAVGSSSRTSTSGFCETDTKMLEDISRANPLLSSEFGAPESSKFNSAEKTQPMDGMTAEKEVTEEGKPLNDVVLYGGKEHQEQAWRVDPNTAVSGNMDQAENVDVSNSHDPNKNVAAEADRRVGFEINSMPDLSEKETSHSWKAVHSVPPYKRSQTAGATPTPPFTCQIDAKLSQEISHESHPRTSSAKNVRRSYKNNAEDKTRSLSDKADDKENDKERKFLKEIVSMKHTIVSGSNSLQASPTSPAAVPQVVQAGEVRAVGFTERSSIKSSVVTTPQNSNLPDLNSSASSHTLCQQPFTDFQQVQLRAQIFVYGSIIQGTAPDEACMLAAFGNSDAGGCAWENAWRVTVERLHNQKSPQSNAKTPVHQHTGVRATETTRQTIHRSEAICTPGSVDSNKFPNMPFSSPIWTLSTACRDGTLSSGIPKGPLLDSSQTFLPLQSYHSPHMRHYAGSSSPWLVQAPSHHLTLPVPETVRVTPVRESSVSHHCGKGHAPSSPSVHSGSPPRGHAGKSLVMDAKRTTISPAKHASVESKPRKKRKNVPLEESGQISSLVQPWGVPVSVPTQSPTSVSTTTITPAMNITYGSANSASSQIASVTPQSPIFVTAASVTSTSAMNVSYGSSISASSPVGTVTAQSPKAVAISTVTSSMNVASGSLVSGSSSMVSAHDRIFGGGEAETRDALQEDMCSRVEESKQHAEEAAALAATAVRHCQSIWGQLAAQKNSGAISELQAKLESSAVTIAAAASVAKAAAAVAKVASDAAVQAKLMADEALVTSKCGNHAAKNSLHNDAKGLGRVTPSSILKGRDQTNNADSVLVAARKAAKKRVEAASAAAKRAENLDAVLKAAEMTAEAVSQAGTIIAMGEPLPFTLTELVDGGPEGYWKVQQKSPERLVKSNIVLKEQTYKDGIKEGFDGSIEEFNGKLLNKEKTNQPVEFSKEILNRTTLLAGLQRDTVSSSGQALGAQKGTNEHDLSKTIGVVPESQVVSENASITICTDESEGQKLVRTPYTNNFEEGSLVEVRSDGEGLGTVWLSAKVLSLKDGKAFVSYIEPAHHEGSSQPTEWVPLEGKEGNAPRIRNPHPMSVIKYEGTKKRNRAARGDYTWSVGDNVDAWIHNGWREGIIMERSTEDETNFTVKFPGEGETSVVRAWNLRPSLIWEGGKWIEWCRPVGSNCLPHEGEEKPAKKSRVESESEAKVKDNITKLAVIMEQGKPEAAKPLVLSAKEKVFNAGKNTKKDELGRKLTGLQKDGSKVNIGVPQPGKKRKFMEVSKVSKPTMFKSGKPASSRVVQSDPISLKKKPTSDHAAADTTQSKGKATPVAVKNNAKGGGASHHDSFGHAPDVQSKLKATPIAEKSIKNNIKGSGAGHDSFGNFMPNSVEPRRSNRRIQPTSRLLEGLQSSLIASKIPTASHDKGAKAPNKGVSRGRNHG